MPKIRAELNRAESVSGETEGHGQSMKRPRSFQAPLPLTS